jgi:hypothetical protein
VCLALLVKQVKQAFRCARVSACLDGVGKDAQEHRVVGLAVNVSNQEILCTCVRVADDFLNGVFHNFFSFLVWVWGGWLLFTLHIVADIFCLSIGKLQKIQ